MAGPEAVRALWALLVVAVPDALPGMALGLLSSAFTRTELQAVRFLPAIVLPQTAEAMQQVTQHADVSTTLLRDTVIITGCIALALGGGAATLRRRMA